MSVRTTRSKKRSLADADVEEPTVPKKSPLPRPSRDIRSFFDSSEPAGSPDSSSSAQPPQKKAKRVPAPKKTAARKVTGKKASTPKKICEDAFKDVDKVFNQLMKKYKPNPKGWAGSGVVSCATILCVIIDLI
jgi:hypothetical protein